MKDNSVLLSEDISDVCQAAQIQHEPHRDASQNKDKHVFSIEPIATVTVGPDGKIYYYLLPGVDVWGLTLPEARDRLEREAAEARKRDEELRRAQEANFKRQSEDEARRRLSGGEPAPSPSIPRGSAPSSPSSYQRRARSTTRCPASTNRRLRSAWVATTVPLPGSDSPSA